MTLPQDDSRPWRRRLAGLVAATAAILLVAGPILAAGSTTTFLPALAKNYAAATATYQPGSSAALALGAGHADASPHQLIRTSDDRAILFAGKMANNVVRVYRQVTSGLPTSPTEFSAGATVTVPSGNVIAVDAAYDGVGLVYVVANTSSGGIYLMPYEVGSGQFRATLTLASDGGQLVNGSGLYAGTEGLAMALDFSGVLHVAYWTNGYRIRHCTYTYTNNQVTTCNPFTVDAGGAQATHPAVAISPVDGALTVAWQSDPTTNPGLNSRVLARRRGTDGSWGTIETVSTVPPYYGRGSNGNEINVDTGPSLLITTDGVRHLVFNQHFDATGDYGRVIYVRNSGSGWVTTSLNWYSHASVIASGSGGRLAIIGHGGSKSTSAVEACKNNRNMCYSILPAGGSWGQAQLFAQYSGDLSYDGSPSAKWSAVGHYRPETIEFAFFSIRDSTGYFAPTLHYGRLP